MACLESSRQWGEDGCSWYAGMTMGRVRVSSGKCHSYGLESVMAAAGRLVVVMDVAFPAELLLAAGVNRGACREASQTL